MSNSRQQSEVLAMAKHSGRLKPKDEDKLTRMSEEIENWGVTELEMWEHEWASDFFELDDPIEEYEERLMFTLYRLSEETDSWKQVAMIDEYVRDREHLRKMRVSRSEESRRIVSELFGTQT